MRWSTFLAGSLVGLLFLCGCSKFKVEVDREVALGEDKEILLDAFKRDQKLNITVTPTGAPFDVCLFLEADRDAAMAAFHAKGNNKLLLVSRNLEQETQLEATVPAGSPAVFHYAPNKKSGSIKIKIAAP